MAGIILETTLLIDLEREASRAVDGPVHAFLREHEQDSLYLTFTTAGELAAGTSMNRRTNWEEYLRSFRVLEFNLDVAWFYGTTYRFLQQNGMLIGGNDTWIAATALAYRMPLATRNQKHFHRVPNLEVLSY